MTTRIRFIIALTTLASLCFASPSPSERLQNALGVPLANETLPGLLDEYSAMLPELYDFSDKRFRDRAVEIAQALSAGIEPDLLTTRALRTVNAFDGRYSARSSRGPQTQEERGRRLLVRKISDALNEADSAEQSVMLARSLLILAAQDRVDGGPFAFMSYVRDPKKRVISAAKLSSEGQAAVEAIAQELQAGWDEGAQDVWRSSDALLALIADPDNPGAWENHGNALLKNLESGVITCRDRLDLQIDLIANFGRSVVLAKNHRNQEFVKRAEQLVPSLVKRAEHKEIQRLLTEALKLEGRDPKNATNRFIGTRIDPQN